MKNIVIIEDEHIAAQHLQRLLADTLPDIHIETTLQSIEECVEYFKSIDWNSTQHPDLVFMDIHLADGISFRIFDQVQVLCPIIFTTAYDQYALDAFKVNAIDYLLKPISPDDLRHALHKLDTLVPVPSNITQALSALTQHYRSHFLVPHRDKLIPLSVNQIACFYLEDKITRALLLDGQQLSLDRPLDSLMELLDPATFFRANRQYIVAHQAITEISIWPISKLALTLSVPTPERIIISKARVPEFKNWYTK